MIQVCDAVMGTGKSSATKTCSPRNIVYVSTLPKNKVLTAIKSLVTHSFSTIYNISVRPQNGEKYKLAETPITTAFFTFSYTCMFYPNPLTYGLFLCFCFCPQNGEKLLPTKYPQNFYRFIIVTDIEYIGINTYFCIALVDTIVCNSTKSFFPSIYIK